MLAQSFMSAADLGITEPQRDALQKVLVLLETEKLVHAECFLGDSKDRSFSAQFNMSSWDEKANSCGTVACIGGTAELISGKKIFNEGFVEGEALNRLFYPEGCGRWFDITTAQAARALRSYLTTGDANWAEAVA